MQKHPSKLSAFRRWWAPIVVAMVLAAGTSYLAIPWVADATETPRTLQHCKVTEKSNRVPPEAHARTSTLPRRYVYTDRCGNFEETDYLPKRFLRSKELFERLEVGQTYDLEVAGRLRPEVVGFPVILKATRTG